MSGYTPLFHSLTTGTLCGKWPDIGLWPIVLSLSDRHGVVDVTPAYLAGVTGLSVAEVEACMERFCQPDKYSRSSAEDGARLKLIAPESRNWGWIVVNHGKYAEKARKSAYDSDRTASGEDAARKRHERAMSRVSGERPAMSRDLPLSDKTRQDKNKNPPTPQGGDSPPNLNPEAWSRWETYRREIRKPLKPASIPAAQRKLAAFGKDQAAVVEQSVANGWTGMFPLKGGPVTTGERGFVC